MADVGDRSLASAAMSIRITDQAWRLSQSSGNELLLLLALADNADEDSRLCWPSVPYLAKKTRLGVRTVQRLLEKLAAAGEIEITRRPQKSSVYKLRAWSEAQAGGSHHNGVSVAPVYGVSLAPYGDTAVTPGIVSRSLVRRDEIWDSLTEIFGAAETDSAKTLRGKVCRSLKRAHASAEDIHLRAARWPDLFDDATLTELALEKHWGALDPTRSVMRRSARRYGRGMATSEIVAVADQLRKEGR